MLKKIATFAARFADRPNPSGPFADLVGSTIGGYRVVRKIGEGGMGQVYLAQHERMGRKAALKVMHPVMLQDPDASSRFKREAENASQINHPNVAAVYDFDTTPNGITYLAMEFVDGPTLTSLINQHGALVPARAADIVYQVAEALGAAHDLTIIHRDLKPDNIMLTRRRDGGDFVKVVDFGIAKAAENEAQKVTRTGLVVGTPEYMSPEQLGGERIDARSDVYSLGLVAFRLLSGELPFASNSLQELMRKRFNEKPKTLADMKPDTPWTDDVQRAMDRALELDVAKRFQSPPDFAQALSAAITGMQNAETLVIDHPSAEAIPTAPTSSPREPGDFTKVFGRLEAPTEPVNRTPEPIDIGPPKLANTQWPFARDETVANRETTKPPPLAPETKEPSSLEYELSILDRRPADVPTTQAPTANLIRPSMLAAGALAMGAAAASAGSLPQESTPGSDLAGTSTQSAATRIWKLLLVVAVPSAALIIGLVVYVARESAAPQPDRGDSARARAVVTQSPVVATDSISRVADTARIPSASPNATPPQDQPVKQQPARNTPSKQAATSVAASVPTAAPRQPSTTATATAPDAAARAARVADSLAAVTEQRRLDSIANARLAQIRHDDSIKAAASRPVSQPVVQPMAQPLPSPVAPTPARAPAPAPAATAPPPDAAARSVVQAAITAFRTLNASTIDPELLVNSRTKGFRDDFIKYVTDVDRQAKIGDPAMSPTVQIDGDEAHLDFTIPISYKNNFGGRSNATAAFRAFVQRSGATWIPGKVELLKKFP